MITVFDVIEHISPEKLFDFFGGMKWVLIDRGRLVLTTPNKHSLHNCFWGHRMNPKHYQEYDVTELKKLLMANGFEIENLRGNLFPHSHSKD